MTLTMERHLEQREVRSGFEAPVSRRMVWIKTRQMEAWTCIGCAWAFIPSGPPIGGSLDEMILNYELRRDREYACHACSEHPRAKGPREKSTFNGQFDDQTRSSVFDPPRGRNEVRGEL